MKKQLQVGDRITRRDHYSGRIISIITIQRVTKTRAFAKLRIRGNETEIGYKREYTEGDDLSDYPSKGAYNTGPNSSIEKDGDLESLRNNRQLNKARTWFKNFRPNDDELLIMFRQFGN